MRSATVRAPKPPDSMRCVQAPSPLPDRFLFLHTALRFLHTALRLQSARVPRVLPVAASEAGQRVLDDDWPTAATETDEASREAHEAIDAKASAGRGLAMLAADLKEARKAHPTCASVQECLDALSALSSAGGAS